MDLEWLQEPSPTWNEDKKRIVGVLPEVFPNLATADEGATLPGNWWRVEHGGEAVGYGWMDTTWGDAEVALAVAPGNRSKGIGSFILENLATEATQQGLRNLFNHIPHTHPEPHKLRSWLEDRGFGLSEDGLLKRAF